MSRPVWPAQLADAGQAQTQTLGTSMGLGKEDAEGAGAKGGKGRKWKLAAVPLRRSLWNLQLQYADHYKARRRSVC